MYHSANISDPKGAKRDKSVMLILLLEWRKRRVRLIIWLLCVAVPSDSLPSIMAVSSSSPYLLLRLLLISSLSWVSTAFLMDRDGATSSSRSPPSLHRQKNWDWPLSADPGAHQTLTSDAAHKRLVDICYHVLCQKCRKCCARGSCGNVYCWANATCSRLVKQADR